MADTTQQLTFKLVLDGKEAVATLDTTEGKFIETEQALDKVAQQGRKITEVESYIQNLGKDFDGVNVSVKDLIERHTELQNKLKSENIGGEAYQRWAREIAVIEQELDKATAKLQITQLANEGLIDETLKYSMVNEESVNSLSEYITSQNLSTETIENSVRALELEIKTLAVNSDAWKQKVTASVNLRSALSNITASQSGFNSAVRSGLPGTNQMNMAIMQFGYVLNDAQMFMVNARMGMMGIANNIPMIVQNFIQAKNAAGESATALQLITKSIMGGGGLIIGINALMFAMNILPSIISNANDELDAFDKTIGSVIDNLVKLENPMEGLEFSIKPEDIGRLAANIDQRIKITEIKSSAILSNAGIQAQGINIGFMLNELGLVSGLNDKEKERLKTNEKLIEKLKDMKATLEAQKVVQETMNENDIKATETKEKKNKNINTTFDKADKELTAFQEHNVKMAEIEGKSDAEILLMKKDNLVKRIDLYEKYKQDVTGLLYALTETEAQLQKSLQPPERPEIIIEGQTEDLVLKDIKDRTDYENSLQEQSLSNWYASEDKKIQAYENYTDLKISLDEEYNRRKGELDRRALINNLNNTSEMLGNIVGLFAKHTVAYQMFAKAQALIDTYTSAESAYKAVVGIPIVGPALAVAAAAAAIAAGLARVEQIGKVEVPKGYATGGRLPVGKTGFIEGTHNELIAPEEDFKSIFKTYSADLVKSALVDARNYISVNNSSSSNADSLAINRELRDLLWSIKNDGISARAYLDDREAKRVNSRGAALNRKNKL